MTDIRKFRNSDPPGIARVWNSQLPRRGLVRTISPWTLDELVFNKPYFDRHGLLIAQRDDRVIGFAHAGFGPDETEAALNFEMGATLMLMVASDVPDRDEVARDLLTASEDYQRARGAKLLYAGGMRPINPFYLGLYGGSELPGVLESDPNLPFYLNHGYIEIDRCQVMQCEIRGFRSPLDRRFLQVRRRYTVQNVNSPAPDTWWAACTLPPTEVLRFEVVPREGGAACGSVGFWHIEPLASDWRTTAVGLIDMEVQPSFQRGGLATFLCCESIKLIKTIGVELIEVQTMVRNTAALGLYHKLGFRDVEQGVVLRKSA